MASDAKQDGGHEADVYILDVVWRSEFAGWPSRSAGRKGNREWELRNRLTRITGELAFYRCWSSELVPLQHLVAVAGRRWSIEESFQATKTGLDLGQHQHRRWKAWHRWTTLSSPPTRSSPQRQPSAPKLQTA